MSSLDQGRQRCRLGFFRQNPCTEPSPFLSLAPVIWKQDQVTPHHTRTGHSSLKFCSASLKLESGCELTRTSALRGAAFVVLSQLRRRARPGRLLPARLRFQPDAGCRLPWRAHSIVRGFDGGKGPTFFSAALPLTRYKIRAHALCHSPRPYMRSAALPC